MRIRAGIRIGPISVSQNLTPRRRSRTPMLMRQSVPVPPTPGRTKPDHMALRITVLIIVLVVTCLICGGLINAVIG